jgi:hypothetical protein
VRETCCSSFLFCTKLLGDVRAYIKGLGFRAFEKTLIAVKGDDDNYEDYMLLKCSNACPYLTQISRHFNAIFKGTEFCDKSRFLEVNHPYVEERVGTRIGTGVATHPEVIRAATEPLPEMEHFRNDDTNASKACGQVLNSLFFRGPDFIDRPLREYEAGDNLYCSCQRRLGLAGRRPAAFVLEAREFGERALHCFRCDRTRWIVGVYDPTLAECNTLLPNATSSMGPSLKRKRRR